MESCPTHFFHIASKDDFEAAGHTGTYSCTSLKTEGFIHCCFDHQLSGVIERYYRGVSELLLLTIDVAGLESDVKYENTVGGTELFPHVYGPINLDSVSGSRDLDTSSGLI